MARRTVVEVDCSRCDRKELVDESKLPQTGTGSPAILIRMEDGTTVQFDDLCGPCKTAVSTHVAAIGKKIEGVSPERKKGAVVPLEKLLGIEGETSATTTQDAKKEREAKKKDPPPSGPSFG